MFRLSRCSSQSCSIFNGLEPDVISSVCLMMADTGTNSNVTCYCICSAGIRCREAGRLQVFMAASERKYMKRHWAVKLQQKMANKSHRLVINLAFWQASHISVRFKWSDWTTTLNCTGCLRWTYFWYNPHAAGLEMFTRVCAIELCNNNRFAWQIQINVSISDDGLVILL